MHVTKSLAMNQEDMGSLVFVKGEHIGKIIRFHSGETLLLGRDSKKCSIIFRALDISREHCRISYDKESGIYTIKDISSNGCFINGKRLKKEKTLKVPAGTKIDLGKHSQELILG